MVLYCIKINNKLNIHFNALQKTKPYIRKKDMVMLKHVAGVNTVLTKNTKRDQVCYRDTPPASLNLFRRIWGLTTDKTALAAHLGTNSITYEISYKFLQKQARKCTTCSPLYPPLQVALYNRKKNNVKKDTRATFFKEYH